MISQWSVRDWGRLYRSKTLAAQQGRRWEQGKRWGRNLLARSSQTSRVHGASSHLAELPRKSRLSRAACVQKRGRHTDHTPHIGARVREGIWERGGGVQERRERIWGSDRVQERREGVRESDGRSLP
ncbi:hypothetical protein T492DRAFT_223790 [Pavlovales sp. CCMP2436]|nr:hypothetical protein T492DRAFT_223790 [Pavlovales sp. CCMP2436]